MKKLKKLLILVLVLFSLALPVQTSAPLLSPSVTASAASSSGKLKIKSLSITTGKKSKSLTLSWSKVSGAKGYVVSRSTTGKKGSYKKIATVKGKTSFTDSKLSSSKAYYYAVRPYSVKKGKTTYGSYKYADLSTKPTKAFIKKKLIAADKAIWGVMSGFEVDYSTQKIYKGQPYLLVKTFSSKKQMKNYLSKLLTPSVYENYLSMYRDIDGKLYIIDGGIGLLGYSDWTISKLKIGDKTCYAYVDGYLDFLDEDYPTSKVKLVYKNGRWLVATDKSFPLGISFGTYRNALRQY